MKLFEKFIEMINLNKLNYLQIYIYMYV